MNWYYATKDKTQAGPVDEAAIGHLLRAGTITAETLIWKEGMENWAPLSSIPELSVQAGSATMATPVPGEARCAECGQPFPPDQLISLAGRSICGSCKPLAVQKFQEGVVSFGRTMDAEELWKMVEQRGYDFTIGSVLSRTWDLVKGNFWPSVGVTLLCYLILVGSQQIPFLGLLAVFLVQPQIMAGLNWYFLKQFRGEPATLNDSFEGFRRGYGQQALYMLIVTGIMLGAIAACAIPLAIVIPAISSASSEGGNTSGIFVAILIVVLVPIVLAIWYFMFCWLFTPILILDRGLKAMEAMKLSRRVVRLRFWKLLGLFLVVGLMCMVSVLLICVGLLVMLPIAFGVLSRIYEDIFGEREPARVT